MKPDTPSTMHAVYAARRATLARQLAAAGRSLAIVPTAPERARNRDSEFAYRHDSYFYYLTGFSEPGACLVLTSEGRSILFCRPKDREREIWDGYRLGPDAAPAALGVDEAHPIGLMDEKLPALLGNTRCVWWPFATHEGLQSQVDAWLGQVRAKVRQGIECPAEQRDVCKPLDEMRLFKDAHEQAIMRRAGAISAQAHVRAMQHSARALKAGQDLREYHLEAELLHEFRRHGSQAVAYNSIVAAGPNACVLHYRADAAPIRDGELVLIDAGCELDGYASDITRTFPANGRFTAPQRALYDIVLAAQAAAVAATKPGALFTDPHDAAVRVLSQGMLDVGLIDKTKVASVDDAIATRAYFPFYMHRTGHWLGMDVHDCGEYLDVNAEPREERDALGNTLVRKPHRALQAGMVLTIEPGIYVRPDAAENVPEHFHHIGIRIEDDAIVTAAGCELITREVPVAADAIEALMAA